MLHFYRCHIAQFVNVLYSTCMHDLITYQNHALVSLDNNTFQILINPQFWHFHKSVHLNVSELVGSTWSVSLHWLLPSLVTGCISIMHHWKTGQVLSLPHVYVAKQHCVAWLWLKWHTGPLPSFLPQTIRDWNSLPMEVVEAPTLDTFVSRVSNWTVNYSIRIFHLPLQTGNVPVAAPVPD